MSRSVSLEIPPELLNKLNGLQDCESKTKEVIARSVARMYNRSQASNDPGKGGTPHSHGQWGPEGYPGGNLMRSATPSPATGEFGYTVEYAPYVEFGHRTRSGGNVPGQHYLQANVNLEEKEIIKDLEEIIKNA